MSIEFQWIRISLSLNLVEVILLLSQDIFLWILMGTLWSTFDNLVDLLLIFLFHEFLLVHLVLLLNLMIHTWWTVLWVYLLLNLLNILNTGWFLMFALSHIWFCSFIAQVWIKPNAAILDHLLLLDIWVHLLQIYTLSTNSLIDSSMLSILLVKSLKFILLQEFLLTTNICICSTISLVQFKIRFIMTNINTVVFLFLNLTCSRQCRIQRFIDLKALFKFDVHLIIQWLQFCQLLFQSIIHLFKFLYLFVFLISVTSY